MVSRAQIIAIQEPQGRLLREPVAPALGVGGEPPTPAFYAACEKARAGPYDLWLKYRERCTGVVAWNLPGRATTIPLVGAVLPLAAGLVPGGQEVLGLLGGGGMDGGFQGASLGGGFGIGGGGACPPGTYCRGVPIETPLGSTCIGSCVPLTGGTPYTPDVQLPGKPTVPKPPVYGKLDPYGKKRRRMNYSNQKALRRALRRATGYARQQKAVKKAAQEFAREFGPKRSRPRRDLGRGHVHIR